MTGRLVSWPAMFHSNCLLYYYYLISVTYHSSPPAPLAVGFRRSLGEIFFFVLSTVRSKSPNHTSASHELQRPCRCLFFLSKLYIYIYICVNGTFIYFCAKNGLMSDEEAGNTLFATISISQSQVIAIAIATPVHEEMNWF